jgi:hypothetical protein
MMEIPRRGVPIQGEYFMARPIQKRWFGLSAIDQGGRWFVELENGRK